MGLLSAMVSPRKLVATRKLICSCVGLDYMTRIDKPSELLSDVASGHVKEGLIRNDEVHSELSCKDHHQKILAIQDAMAVSGKWKIWYWVASPSRANSASRSC